MLQNVSKDLHGCETVKMLLLLLCRYVELSNGLRALLISDLSQAEGMGVGEDRGEEEQEERGEEEGDSGEGSEEEEEEEKEEERDSDFDELDEENAGMKKKGSSEKQVCDQASFVLNDTNASYIEIF